jgi:transcriptional regulator with XRE-family HTH domain
MQPISTHPRNAPYIHGMPGGRPSKTKRSPFGERLATVREQKGLSQREAADLLGMKQQSYAVWERRSMALKPEQLVQVARLFDVSVDFLVGHQGHEPRKTGPSGKARRFFEAISKLPRHQQEKVFSLLEPFIDQYASSSSKAA